MPSRELHARLAELFDAALTLPTTQRDPFLKAQCANDAALLREIRELLAHHGSTSDPALNAPILDAPVDIAAVMKDAASTRTAPPPGIVIPGYRVISVLGEGGMGVVYLGEQDKPRRQVAIKLMRPGAASPALLKRFDLEQELLGRLQHPGIAQIFGTGVCKPFGETGPTQPYFVMEHVRGLPLNEYCQRHGLGTRERLRVLLQVCDAVQHAHARGIVHRDLKPGNILVADQGSEGAQPKILDFGVARATARDIQITTLHTGVGQLVGTLAYMSPEQAAGDPSRIDSRSDIYALAVIGYELLAGRLPLSLHQRSIADAARVIRDEEPQPLSLVNRVFRGDLDTIFSKALGKDPARRYASVADFAADIQRYLDDQPIVARPASTIYNLRKFARRNKGLVAGIALAFVVLMAGVVGTTLAMLEARQQRDEARDAQTAADREADTAQAVTEFVQDMLASPDPLARDRAVAADPRDTRVTDVLDGAGALVGERFADQPLVEAGVRVLLGRTYAHLGLADLAEPHLRRALDIFLEHLGEDDGRTRATLSSLSVLYMMEHRFDEGEALMQRLLEINRRVLGAANPEVLQQTERLALLRTQRADYDGAILMLAELLTLRRESQGPSHADTINTLYNLGWTHARAGRYAEALEIQQQVLALRRAAMGENHVDALADQNNIAWLYERMDRVAEAEAIYADIAARARASLPPDDWHIGTFLHNHASALQRLGRWQEAQKSQLEAISVFEKTFGPEHQRLQAALRGAASICEALGRPEEAAQWRGRLAGAVATTAPATQPDAHPASRSSLDD